MSTPEHEEVLVKIILGILYRATKNADGAAEDNAAAINRGFAAAAIATTVAIRNTQSEAHTAYAEALHAFGMGD